MTTHCGKLFHLAGTAHRKCGARIDGTDRRFQCNDCREANQKGEVVYGRKIYYPDMTGVCMGYPTQDPNEKEVDQILARLESYYHGDEKLARGAKHLSVNTDDLRTLTDYIKYLRGQLRSPNRRG